MASNPRSNWKDSVLLISAVVGTIAAVLALLGPQRLEIIFDWLSHPFPIYAAFLLTILAGGLLIHRRVTGSYEEPANPVSSNALTPVVASNPAGLIAQYGITMGWPTPGLPVKQKVQMSGKYIIKPPDGDVVAYEKETETDGGLFWFKEGTVDFNEATKTWSTVIYIGGKRGTGRKLGLANIGESGRALRHYFLSVPEQCGDQWAGIKVLTSDIVSCADVDVIYR